MRPRSPLVIALLFICALTIGVFGPRSEVPLTENILISSDAHVAGAAAPATTIAENAPLYRVTKVVDGDTFAVDMDGANVTVRLIGLDTPETVDPRKPVQCFGKEASEKAKEILVGASVRLEFDDSQGTYDKYGRLLAYAHLPDGTLFNKYMIEGGYGHEYTYDLPYKYQADFKAAEVVARGEKKGLWAADSCMETQAASLTAPSSAFARTKEYDCSRNAYNCSVFSSHAEAQYSFDLCVGTGNDIHRLDSDRDGRVCELLP